MRILTKTTRALLVSAALASLPTLSVAQEVSLKVGQTIDLTTFDPTQLRLGSYASIGLLYNTLIRMTEDGKYELQLASGLELSEDGNSVTIKLRDDVKFHDGRPMTSQDVAFSFKYAATPEVGANILALSRLVSNVETPDDHTVVLHFSGGQASIYDLLDLIFIIDASKPDAVATSANGTGPYKLESHEPGRVTTFVRNEDYWGSRPQVDKVEIRIVPDPQTAVAQLQSGVLDIIPFTSREAVDQLASTPGVVTGTAAPESRILNLLMNVKDGPTANPHLRQAINLAIDRTRIAADVIGEGGILKCLPWVQRAPHLVVGYENACRYDLEAARAIVKEHGLEGTQVEFMTFAAAVPELGGMAQIVQYSLGQIGINTTIVDLSEAAATQRYRASDFELESHAFARGGRSPEALLAMGIVFRSQGNFSGFESEQYAKDVAIVTGVASKEEKEAAWKRINDFVLSEAWTLPVVSLPVRWAASSRVKNVSFNLEGMSMLSSVTIE